MSKSAYEIIQSHSQMLSHFKCQWNELSLVLCNGWRSPDNVLLWKCPKLREGRDEHSPNNQSPVDQFRRIPDINIALIQLSLCVHLCLFSWEAKQEGPPPQQFNYEQVFIFIWSSASSSDFSQCCIVSEQELRLKYYWVNWNWNQTKTIYFSIHRMFYKNQQVKHTFVFLRNLIFAIIYSQIDWIRKTYMQIYSMLLV